jgi:hypothetical protein
MPKRQPAVRVQIPTLLADSVKNKRAILFLGAGASKEAKNAANQTPPDADQLRDILAERFFGQPMKTRDVMAVAEMAIASSGGAPLVFNEVCQAFEGFRPATIPGKGVTGLVDRRRVVGNAALFASLGIEPEDLPARADALRQEGQGVMLVAVDGTAAGLIAVADPIKDSAVTALAALHAEHIHARLNTCTQPKEGTLRRISKIQAVTEF